jgi:hypothetical protein
MLDPSRLPIAEIRVLSLACSSLVNEKGVGTSTQLVEFTGKLLARLDAITTQEGYGNRYKLLFVDSTGYIYVKVDYATYEALKNGIGSTYRIIGNPSTYVGEAEVVLTSYQSASSVDVDLSALAESADNIAAVHADAARLGLNSKGVAFGRLVTFDAVCYGKADDSVLLFADGDNAIYVHGNQYIGNQFSKGNTYRLIAAITMFNFRPGVEFLAKSSIAAMEFELEPELITANDLYDVKYEVDENAAYPEYSSKFTKLYSHIGYANYYYKDESRYIIIEDAFNENSYSTYQGARSAKAIFIKNEDCTGLYSDYEYGQCPFSEYIDLEPIQITTIFMPYLWNSNDYWQGYYLDVSIVE